MLPQFESLIPEW